MAEDMKDPELEKAHNHSSHHRGEILASDRCGCFYCLMIFPPTAILEWLDFEPTAQCPGCGIDSVIGSKSGYPITPEFLARMYDYWFGYPPRGP